MRVAMAFLAGLLCSTMVVLVAAQSSSAVGRYQIAAGWETSEGMLFQLDTYTGRLYARHWSEGRVYDLGLLDRPLAMPHATKARPSQ